MLNSKSELFLDSYYLQCKLNVNEPILYILLTSLYLFDFMLLNYLTPPIV